MRSSSSLALDRVLAVRPRRGLRAVPAQGAEIRLVERLLQGPLTTADALQCAADIATVLRQLHSQAKTHGNVSAASIILRESSAFLAPGPGTEAAQHDVKSFGTLLHLILHGAPSNPASKSTDRLIASATNLAHRCMSADRTPEMRKVAVELRVLALLARQRAAQPASAAVVDPATAPGFDLRPARTLTPTKEACPKCGSHYVYSSKPRTWMENLCTTKLGMPLQRCHRCYHRYCTMLGLKLARNAPSA